VLADVLLPVGVQIQHIEQLEELLLRSQPLLLDGFLPELMPLQVTTRLRTLELTHWQHKVAYVLPQIHVYKATINPTLIVSPYVSSPFRVISPVESLCSSSIVQVTFSLHAVTAQPTKPVLPCHAPICVSCRRAKQSQSAGSCWGLLLLLCACGPVLQCSVQQRHASQRCCQTNRHSWRGRQHRQHMCC
jgi:hypothetical protein